ncbi:unnamed protein product [Peronospora belbahrii]|uniref:Uncharacterized protein n=1 Tax=Peronospora belbahrii TaxID=622444 RepID=A0ABN8CU22_9STRA|nr:unnamed protein product [Peronospora belbahrii]
MLYHDDSYTTGCFTGACSIRDSIVQLARGLHGDCNYSCAHYVYRLTLRPAPSYTQLNTTFPLYLELPAPGSSNPNKELEMCPPEIGAFSLVEQLQCEKEERQQTCDSTSAGQASALFGGTLVAALLVYSLLPYVRARNRKRHCSRSRTTSEDRLSWLSDQLDTPTTPTIANGANLRTWETFDGDKIEPVRAYRDGHRKRNDRHSEAVNGNAVSDAVSELLQVKLPDFNDARGWQTFFDSQIYHNELQDKEHAATNCVSNRKSRGGLVPSDSSVVERTNLRETKFTSTTDNNTTRSERYRTIRDRIDRAATEAAIDDAQSFNEFWQM